MWQLVKQKQGESKEKACGHSGVMGDGLGLEGLLKINSTFLYNVLSIR